MKIMLRILRWLDDHALMWCDSCGDLHFRKNIIFERKTTGRIAPLCHECHDRIFKAYWVKPK